MKFIVECTACQWSQTLYGSPSGVTPTRIGEAGAEHQAKCPKLRKSKTAPAFVKTHLDWETQ